MDEFDKLLKDINEEKFWQGKKWTDEQIRKMVLFTKISVTLVVT